MTKEINVFINKLSSDWEPIKEQAVKYFDLDSKIRGDGAIQIFRLPWIAPQNFGLLLFPPVNKAWFIKFKENTSIEIPLYYQEILLKMNGCIIYDFSLFGLPKTMYTSGLLSRGNLQQFDLAIANTYWKQEYEIDQNLFHIGGNRYSYTENIGYFIDSNNNTILSIRTNGQILNKWDNFKDFLIQEIESSEKMMLDKKGKNISNNTTEFNKTSHKLKQNWWQKLFGN